MNTLECTIEGCWRLVSIFSSNFRHFGVSVLEVKRSGTHPSAPDIFRQRHSRNIGKHPLKMMRRTAGDFSCFAIGNLPGKIFLNILDCLV